MAGQPEMAGQCRAHCVKRGMGERRVNEVDEVVTVGLVDI